MSRGHSEWKEEAILYKVYRTPQQVFEFVDDMADSQQRHVRLFVIAYQKVDVAVGSFLAT